MVPMCFISDTNLIRHSTNQKGEGIVSGNQMTSCKTRYFHKPCSDATFTQRAFSSLLLLSEVVQSYASLIMKSLCTNLSIEKCPSEKKLSMHSSLFFMLWCIYSRNAVCVRFSEGTRYTEHTGNILWLISPKMVVYMPQISTHKHHSLEGSENTSQCPLPTDYAMINVVWNLWPRQAVN